MLGLEKIIIERNLKKKDLSDSIGVSPVQLSNWIKKQRPIPKHHIMKLVNLLGVDEKILTSDFQVTISNEVIHSIEDKPYIVDRNEFEYYMTMKQWETTIRHLKENDIDPDRAIKLIKLALEIKSL